MSLKQTDVKKQRYFVSIKKEETKKQLLNEVTL